MGLEHDRWERAPQVKLRSKANATGKKFSNLKHQIPNKTSQKGFCPCLDIVIWCLFEIWYLVLGFFARRFLISQS
jgi:hypothetical protein